MELHIITPIKKESFTIAWLEAETLSGNYVIQSGYAPTILVLKEQEPVTFRLKSGKQESFLVTRGVIEVERSLITVVVTKSS